MKLLDFYILSISTIIAFVLFNVFQVDFMTSLLVIGLGYACKIMFYWGLILYDNEKAEAFRIWESQNFTGVIKK